MGNIWKEEAIIALRTIGKPAHLNDIFEQIKKQGNIDLSVGKTPKRTLSGTLQNFSLSSAYGIEDTFFSVYGVEARKGYWGLSEQRKGTGEVLLTQEDEMFSEGEKNLKIHLIRERNQELIKKAKKRFLDNNDGRLFCEVCGFDFFEKYGELGKDFIEAHHCKPVSEMKSGEKTDIKDIVMVCSNCHSMIHRRKPWLSKAELMTILRQ